MLCRGEAPVVVSMCDCMDHINDEKKDAKYSEIYLKRRQKSGIHHIVLHRVFLLTE